MSVPFYRNELRPIAEDPDVAVLEESRMNESNRLNSARLNELSNTITDDIYNNNNNTVDAGSNSIPLVDVHEIWNDPLVKSAKKKHRFAAPSDISSTKGIQAGFDGRGNASSSSFVDIENNHHQNHASSMSMTMTTTANHSKIPPEQLSQKSNNTTSNNNNNNKATTTKNIAMTIFSCIFLLFVVLCFALILQLSNKDDSDNLTATTGTITINNEYDDSNSRDDDNDDSLYPRSAYQKRVAELLANEIGVPTILPTTTYGTVIPNTPQLEALNWLENDAFSRKSSMMYPLRLIQRYVLLVLYFSTNGAHWTTTSTTNKNKNFPNNQRDECEWDGIICDRQLIQSLNFGNFNITGKLPREIGWLPSLWKIYLEENSFTGTIPNDFFDNLQILDRFDASNNAFTGTIPATIWTRSNIKYAFLNNNHFSGNIWNGDGTGTSIAAVSNQLKQIWLQGNQLTGTLPSWINGGYLPLLEHLILSNNELSGTITDNFSDATMLSFTSLSFNQFTGPLPISLWNCQNLFLDNNQFSGVLPTSQQIFEKTQAYAPEKIEILQLSYNQLSGTIPPNFGQNWPVLQELQLQGNDQLSGEVPCSTQQNENENEKIWQVGCNISCDGCCSTVACP